MRQVPLHVVFCGLDGFPFGSSAAMNKMTATARGLKEAGARVTIIGRKGVLSPEQVESDQPSGVYEGIEYDTASGSLLRPQGFLKRNWQKFKGIIREFALIHKLATRENASIISLDTPYLSVIWMYRLMSRIYGLKLVYTYVEMRSEINVGKKSAYRTWEHNYIDQNIHKLFDGYLAISSLLEDWIKAKDPNKNIHRCPVLADYKLFDRPRTPGVPPFFLYAGSSAYEEVIYFILEAFEGLPTSDDLQLYLIIRGPADKQKKVKARIAASPRTDKIKTFVNLPYDDLAQKYVDATGLLIPLRNNKQDAARFPYKVSEYLATGNPVITTNYGELGHYFQDGYNGLVAEEYDVALFQEKMLFLLENLEACQEMGEKGREMGLANFHYARQGELIRDYFTQLLYPETASNPKEEVSLS